MGLWAGQGGEGAKCWLHVLTELENRGVADTLIVVCDGLPGLPGRRYQRVAPVEAQRRGVVPMAVRNIAAKALGVL